MLELYPLIKPLHVVLALVSGTGFALRGWWMLRSSPRLGARWVRIAPHVLDTALLASGVYLAVALRLSPLAQPWLGAKLVLLVAYIGCGAVALRRGRTLPVRATALALALALGCYALILASALTQRPLGLP